MVRERQEGAALNLELQPDKQDGKQVYQHKDPAARPAARPATKTDAHNRADALQGNQCFLDGVPHTSAAHSCQRTGFYCSHCFMKLFYWDDEACRNPNCMHCAYNEVHSLCNMVCGGTGTSAIYTLKRLPQIADYEVHVNGRFPELQRFVSGPPSCKVLEFQPASAQPSDQIDTGSTYSTDDSDDMDDGMADNLGCPVFKSAWEDDLTGNMCLVESLLPCKLALLPQDSHAQKLVVVSRLASFLQQVLA